MRLAIVLGVLLAAPLTHAAPTVTVYGAEWCGPCHKVRDYLRLNGVAFDFVDIDQDGNRERFAALAGGNHAIPLTVVGAEKVRGAAYSVLGAALIAQGVLPSPKAPPPGVEQYGGHSVEWWQQQFQSMRARVRSLSERLAALDKVAVDHHERGVVLPRLRTELSVAEASLNQLELDASRASLPRRYRAY